MKFVIFAGVTMALVGRQTGPGEILAADIDAIIAAVNNLTDAVISFQSALQADALIDASQAVVAALAQGTTDADASPVLTDNDVLPFVQQLVDLGPTVNNTVTTLLAKKQVFVESGRGCEVFPQLVQQLDGTNAFNNSLIAKTPQDLLIVAVNIAQPIVDSLNAGIAAFKDVQCTATTSFPVDSPTALPTDTGISSPAASTTGVSASETTSTPATSLASAAGTITSFASTSHHDAMVTAETDVTTSVPNNTSVSTTSFVSAAGSITSSAKSTTRSHHDTMTTTGTDVTTTVPNNTGAVAMSSEGITTTKAHITMAVPCISCITGTGTAATNPVSETSTVTVPTGGTGSGSGSGSGNKSDNNSSGPVLSPTSLVIAGVSGRQIPFGVAVAVIMGVVVIVV